jgi:hypothetical protein
VRQTESAIGQVQGIAVAGVFQNLERVKLTALFPSKTVYVESHFALLAGEYCCYLHEKSI